MTDGMSLEAKEILGIFWPTKATHRHGLVRVSSPCVSFLLASFMCSFGAWIRGVRAKIFRPPVNAADPAAGCKLQVARLEAAVLILRCKKRYVRAKPTIL